MELLDKVVGCIAFRFSTVAGAAGVPAVPPRNGDAQAVTSRVVMMGTIS